jgi:hypothetical protein
LPSHAITNLPAISGRDKAEAGWWRKSASGQSLLDVRPWAAGEVRFGQRTDLIPMRNPLTHAYPALQL